MIKTPSLRLPSHKSPDPISFLTEKKSYSIENFVTEEGKTLPSFELGYETYGQLNDQGDNAILICHYFSGNSHAAGRYSAQDPEPGYWDDLIGPGKGIDTHKYFIVSVDILCNACPHLPFIKTIGPSTLEETTQKPYGMNFPHITIADMVHSQKIILDFLGVTHLKAVVGCSLGSMQAWQWAADYPDFLDKIIPIIGSGFETHPFVTSAVSLWAKMLTLDPCWNEGNYTPQNYPHEGMKAGLEILTWNCLSSHWAEVYGADGFKKLAEERAKFIEPNHFLYIIKAVQNFSVRKHLPKIKAKALVIAAASDFLMKPEFSKHAVQESLNHGIQASYLEIEGEGGHLDGLFAISKVSQNIKHFIEE